MRAKQSQGKRFWFLDCHTRIVKTAIKEGVTEGGPPCLGKMLYSLSRDCSVLPAAFDWPAAEAICTEIIDRIATDPELLPEKSPPGG